MRRIIVFVALGTSSCLSANTYSTARTLGAGEINHTIAATMYQSDTEDLGTATFVPMPSYGLRVGLTEHFDVGGTIGLPGQLHADLKYQVLRSPYFDVALAPGAFFQLYPTNSGTDESLWLLGAQLGAVANVNVSSGFSFVPWIAPGYAAVPDVGSGALFVRAGLGADIRFAGLSVRPEVSTVYDPARAQPTDLAVGLAVSFGDRPAFAR